jgi:CTP synthase (UTP-ammonia lyase)
MPIHVEGSTAWKEIQAVGDFLMESKKHAALFRDPLSGQDGGPTYPPEVNTDTGLRTRDSTVEPSVVARHRHEITLSKDEVSTIKSGGNVTVATSENNGHQHMITIKWHTQYGFYIALCAGTPEITQVFAAKCWDKHPSVLRVVPDQ